MARKCHTDARRNSRAVVRPRARPARLIRPLVTPAKVPQGKHHEQLGPGRVPAWRMFMRRGLILLIISLAVSPAVLARTNQDWGKVGRLKPGSKVLGILWTGDEIQGRLKSVSPTGLSLVTGSSWKPLQEI